jgi:O-antigen/teichoic acid export membrane protein
VTRNFISGTTLQIFSQGLSLVIVIYLARILGPANYGLFSMTMAIMAYFILAITFGLPTIGIREVARRNDAAMQIWWDVGVLRTGLAVLVYALLLIIAISVPALKDMRNLLIVYGTSLFLTALLPDWTFIGLERMAWPAFTSLIGSALTLGLLFAFVRSADALLAALVCIIAGSFLSVVIQVARLRALSDGRLQLIVPRERLRELMRVAFPFIFASLSSQIYGNADLILVGFIRGKGEAGIYAAAYKVVNLLAIFIGLISQATYPAMARLFKSDPEKSNAFASAMTEAMLAVFLPIALGGTLISAQLTRFFYGAEYAATAKPLAILFWYVLLSALSISFSNALLAINEDRPYITALTGGALIDVALIAFMVPKWGATGAAVAMVIAELFIFLYLAVQARRKLKIKFIKMRTLIPILIATLAMTAAVWALKDRLMVLVVVVCAALIYGIVLGIGFFFMYREPRQEA